MTLDQLAKLVSSVREACGPGAMAQDETARLQLLHRVKLLCAAPLVFDATKYTAYMRGLFRRSCTLADLLHDYLDDTTEEGETAERTATIKRAIEELDRSLADLAHAISLCRPAVPP